jgi:folate-binding protein YgfZ
VLAGWPALGHEIDEKTLPQEVRFDEIGGVSYTKGCYVGQETVARVHFRGHPNRHLEGLLFEREPTTHSAVLAEGNDVGRVTAQVWLGSKHRWLGLAVLRREVDPGSSLVASGVGATVVPLPFAPEII